ncbi:MAG: hypothetical protein CMI30_00495 [Opitutae bacterium]|nr:hypothetical protein [Rhodospirillaceae bacterium]MBL61863.1 hypothetical protein [Opitutae bacterium]|tara:strand:- start:864 stop:2705 length:1842 start_codon:yes stop_codon:yes gene_type:complete
MKKIIQSLICLSLSGLAAADEPQPKALKKIRPVPAPAIKQVPREIAAEHFQKLLKQRLELKNPNVVIRKQIPRLNAPEPLIIPPQQLWGGPVPPLQNGLARPSTTSLPPFQAKKQVEAVMLLDGSHMQGKFISYDDKTGLTWRHPNMKSDLEIDPKGIARVTFAPAKNTTAKPARARVRLINGDTLDGDLAEMNDKHLILSTSFAGRLAVNRAAVQTLIPGETAGTAFYEGPKDAKKWTFTNSNAVNFQGGFRPGPLPPAVQQQLKARSQAKWTLKDGILTSSGSGAQVGREFDKIGDKTNLEFDVQWNSSLSLYVCLLTDNLKSYSMGNSYCLRISQTSAYMYRYENANGRRRTSRLGSTVRYNISGAPRAHVSIRVDKTKKRIVLYINGKQAGLWNDPGKFVSKKNGILFSARTSNPMAIANIRLSEWSGQIQQAGDNSIGDGKEDFLRLVNNDTLTGQLMDIKRGRIEFKPEFGEVIPIPIERVNLIRLADPAKDPADAQNPVRAKLRGRGQITATLKSWKDNKVILSSPSLGEATVEATAIDSIDFNLGKNNQTQTASVPAVNLPPRNNPAGVININGIQLPEQKLDLRINGARIEVLPLAPIVPKKKR